MLLKERRAAVFRKYPFTIILKDCIGGVTQSLEVKLDLGSKISGIALVAQRDDYENLTPIGIRILYIRRPRKIFQINFSSCFFISGILKLKE